MRLKKSLKREPVEIEEEDGSVSLYELVEMTGTQRDAWLTSEKNRTKWQDGKPVGVNDFTDIQAKLIANCLKDAKGKDVPLQEIASWPSSTQKALYEKCQEINGLTAASEEAAKKA